MGNRKNPHDDQANGRRDSPCVLECYGDPLPWNPWSATEPRKGDIQESWSVVTIGRNLRLRFRPASRDCEKKKRYDDGSIRCHTKTSITTSYLQSRISYFIHVALSRSAAGYALILLRGSLLSLPVSVFVCFSFHLCLDQWVANVHANFDDCFIVF